MATRHSHPCSKVKSVTDRLITGGKIKKAYLGLVANTVAIPEEIQQEAGIEQETGVMVFQVETGAPARKAGLTMGDVIVEFNGKPVTDFYDLPRLLSEDVAGKKTTLTVIRGEKLIELTITPIVKEEENDDQQFRSTHVNGAGIAAAFTPLACPAPSVPVPTPHITIRQALVCPHPLRSVGRNFPFLI